MTFKHIAVFYNEQKPQNRPLAQQTAAWLNERGLTAHVVTSLENLAQTDLLICMGGDGTILHSARAAAPIHIPVLGINCGNLGFLAACEQDSFSPLLDNLLQGKYTLQERLMLQANVFFPNGEKQTFLALNDCVLRAEKPRALLIETAFDRQPAASYFGDGVVISTPTGSTAYALAAGGPIVAPGIEVLLVTPICPHTLTQRPLILPANGELELRPVLKTELDGAFLSMDGQTNLSLVPGTYIQISRYAYPVKLILPLQQDFFSLLHHKLNWGNR
ncbi:MAG: NAD(+)/NADH kinase [Elusimicrobiaceae bacterium]|nr:NAD(+)/NADH kinase [Elusimicrobiaceae bacterium]